MAKQKPKKPKRPKKMHGMKCDCGKCMSMPSKEMPIKRK